VAAYCLAYRSGSRIMGLFGMLLCTVGFASFSFELSHWFIDHNSPWIASVPIAILPLAPAAAIQRYWIGQEPDRLSGSPGSSSLAK